MTLSGENNFCGVRLSVHYRTQNPCYAGIRKIIVPFLATRGRADLLTKVVVRPRFLCGGFVLLKSCSYCGGVHPQGYVCPKKPKSAEHRNRKVAGFRKTYRWQKKRGQIVRRDFHLCRICNEGSYGTFGVPGLDQNLSVHHIEPLEERFDLRLEDENLVTCCSRHHRMADDGDIPRNYLHKLAETSPRWV